MNRIITILIFMFAVQAMSAQTTLNVRFLKSSKWILVENGAKDTVFITFDNEKMYTSEHLHFVHPITKKILDKNLKSDFLYYLSSTLTDNYEASKVGKAANGKYITFHNVTSPYVDSGDFSTFEVTERSDSEIILTLRRFPPDYYDRVGRTITVKKMK